MNVAPIVAPLPGEHFATTSPAMRPETPPDWRHRLNFWSGRALTAEALEIEQEHRAAHLAWQGRIPTAGVVNGLEVALEEPFAPAAPLATAGHFLHVLPGHGFTAFGEDVVIPRPLRIALDQIPIHYVRFRPVGEGPLEEQPAGTNSTLLEFGGVRLDVDAFAPGYLPWAAVLVARPAEFRAFANDAPMDPCELDPSRDAFADERRRDAAMLGLFQLPVAMENDPLLADRASPRWRNRLAYAIFSEEINGAARQFLHIFGTRPAANRWDTELPERVLLPWEYFGVPLALLSSEQDVAGNRRFFLDRASVTRAGGLARPRSRPAALLATEAVASVPGAGTPAVWRARVDQLAEHLGGLPAGAPSAQAARFQFVPPAGILPPDALDFLSTEEAMKVGSSATPPDRAATSRFFPRQFAVEAAPIPTEDLDAALAASAPLAPLDFDVVENDVVRVLVPLPQRVFDPRLLVVELEDPFFAAEVARLIAVRQDWRQRHDFVRLIRDLWQSLASGTPPVIDQKAFEPGQLEPEPVESAAQLDFGALYASPTETAGPWEVSATFDGDEVTELTAATGLFVRLRLDLDRPPSRLEMRWRFGASEVRHVWTEPSDVQAEQFEADGTPLALNLWRLYTVTAAELGVTSGKPAGFTLHLEDGRVGLIDAGKLMPEEGAKPRRIPWWNAEDHAAVVTFTGGEWKRIGADRQLGAPFEEAYIPLFPDGTLDDRLKEIPTLRASAGQPAQGVVELGLVKLIERLEQQLNRADDFVDLSFVKTQANTHRIRQVLLGNEVADDLLISPILSSVVKKTSARIAEEDLVTALRTTRAVTPTDAAPPPGARAAGAATAGIRFGNVAGFNVNVAFKQTALDKLAPKDLSATTMARVTVDDVRQAEPAIGKGFELRTLTIAKRFDAGPVLNAYDYADEGLREIIAHLAEFDLDFDDRDVIPDATGPGDKPVTFREFASGKITLDMLNFSESISPDEHKNSAQADTGNFLARGVRRADAAALVLRRLEFYIARRRALVVRAREVLAELRRQIAAAEARLATIAGPLAEARHDVSVARALRQEDQDRVAAINTRRDALIRDEVKFLAYVRPRAVDPVRRNTPGWKLDPAGTLAPAPACLQRHDQPPEPLRAYVQLFRHAPARWFDDIAPRLRELDTHEKLVELLAATQRSALLFSTEKRIAFAANITAVATRNTLISAFSIVEATRAKASVLQLARPELRSWVDYHHEVEQHSSLGDVIDGRHGHAALAKAAANLLEQIEDVATCLHAEFAGVSPALRLAWVERYSQFDRPAPLNNLAALPRYGSLDRAARRRFQAFADWLFKRVDTAERDAFNLINDLVRICLLLASHAPVRSLIAGHLARPAPVRLGTLFPVRAFDPRLVHVGMEVQVWNAEKVVARARVEDLREDGEISARIERVETSTATLDQTMRVQFVPRGLSLTTGLGSA